VVVESPRKIKQLRLKTFKDLFSNTSSAAVLRGQQKEKKKKAINKKINIYNTVEVLNFMTIPSSRRINFNIT
jgi:hypothetical protein